MIVTSTAGGPGRVPDCPAGSALVASVDVEWSKNYRVTGGNRPFCYSVVHLAVPAAWPAQRTDPQALRWWYTAAYVDHDTETEDLTELADRDLAAALNGADRLVGHQLCSDLAVLAATAPGPMPGVEAARAAWRARRTLDPAHRRVVDTRYDTGHILTGSSRRLVDVCADLRLGVTQPELAGTSMTALHRRWLDAGDTIAREKIIVLNLRHALSAALVAVYAVCAIYAASPGTARPAVNVNRMLAAGLAGSYAWLASPAFVALLAA